MKVNVSLDNVSFKKKPKKEIVYAINNRIASSQVDIDLIELAELVGDKGHTFSPAIFLNGKRNKESFLQMQLIGIDFDTGVPYEDIKYRAGELGLPICFSYHTFSSRPEQPKYRVVFMHECPIEDIRIAEIIIRMLLEIFKEADRNCKDPTRMFFGGKGLIEPINYRTFNIVELCQMFQKTMYVREPKHYVRKIQTFAQNCNLSCVNNVIQIFAYNSGSENGDKTVTDHNIYMSELVFPPNDKKYQVFLGYQPNMRNEYDNAFGKGVKIEHIEKKCQLWYDFKHSVHIEHNLRFLLLTNIIHIDGGEKKFMEVIRSKYQNKIKEWEFYKKYAKDNNYRPMACTECPYSEECNHKTNLVLTLKKEKIKKLDEEEIYYPVEEVYDYVYRTMEQVIESPGTEGMYIIPAQTSLGKTEAYCTLIQNEIDKKFIVAVPTINLKNEIVKRLDKKGITAVGQYQFKIFVYLNAFLKKFRDYIV